MSQFDFIEREILGLSRFLAKTLMQNDIASEELIDEDGGVASEKFLKHTLFRLVLDGKINEAENLLFEWINETPRPEYLSVAVEFYEKLNSMSDEALTRSNFSREEIAEGLLSVKKIYSKVGQE